MSAGTESKQKKDQESVELIDTTGMSESKRAALELTESSREGHWEYPTFAGGLFMGGVDWDLVHPYPRLASDHDERGEEFLRKLEAFFREKVDPDAIDREGEIPQAVIDGLAALGAFGIKIPREYGGLGLAQQYYSRAATLAGTYCGNISALLSAHQSIGVPQPLLLFGTAEQKERFLPRLARGEISAFALTEDGVGSDPACMQTTAEPTPDGQHFVINGKKLWCTNGTRAGLLIVMAKTPPKIVAGRSRDQITAFVVDTKTQGVRVTHRCRFMGLKALYNAVIEFKDVRVPRENVIAGEGMGLRVALTTLNTGRITLPAMCVGLAKRSLQISRKWANERVQWGAPIGRHGAVADKIARMASTLFAMEAMTQLTSLLVDRKKTDIRLEAAMSKMFGSEAAWSIVNEAVQVLGGRGYETKASLEARGDNAAYGIERALRDTRINMIFEGSSEIMRLFIAREALDPHLKAAGEAMNSKLPLSRRLKGALRALTFYVRWYPKQWLPSGTSHSDLDPALQPHARFVDKASRKLARGLFHQMVKHGPKLEREQMLLSRFVEIGTELYAIAASVSRAQALLLEGKSREDVLPLVEHFAAESRIRIDERFRAAGRNNDPMGYRLAQQTLEGKSSFLYEGMVGEKRTTSDEKDVDAAVAIA